jgi:hypothetical protein
VTRDGVARMALTAYPAAVRDARGDEIRATLLDATDGRRLAGFARELGGLAAAGLRVRATDTARVGPARLIADGACLATAWILTRELATLLGQRVRGEHDALLAPWTVALAAVVLALVLIGHDRLGGIGALLWTATRTPALLHDVSASTVLLAAIVPVLCFTVLIVTPRRRPTDLRRLAWLALPIALAAALGPPPWEQNPVLIAAVWLGVLATLAAALVLLPTDPRLALAGALSLSDVALRGLATHPTTPAAFAVAAVGPAAAAVVVLRTRRLQRRAAGAV